MISLKDRFPSRTLLHRGDLALSFRARDSALERDVFIKVLNPQLAHDAEIRGRFEREAKAVARLDHPNLVRIYEYGQDVDEGMYMLLEWVEGGNLSAHLKRRGKLPAAEVETLAKQLLAGLAALHSVGIVHRDLKPENILVKANHPTPPQAEGERMKDTPLGPPTEWGEKSCEEWGEETSEEWGEISYKITDFSLAMLKDAPQLTHHEAIVGTPAYMSPEQAAGGKISEQSDLFSLGVILYEAATGANPLIGESLLDTLRKIRESDVNLDHSAILSLPPKLRGLIESLLRKSADERPRSPTFALKMLDGHASKSTATTARSRVWTVVAVAVVVAGVLWLVTDRSAEERIGKNQKIATMPADSNMSNTDSAAVAIGKESESDTMSRETRSGAPVEAGQLQRDVPVFEERRNLSGTKSIETSPPPRDVGGGSAAIPDSTELWISTEPWAHIYFDGERVGTTPLSSPLKLKSGEHTLELKNPAYPDISLPMQLNEAATRRDLRLADFVALLRASVKPWGDLYLDGELLGTTPLTRPHFLSPGKHELRITHPSLPTLEKTVLAGAGDTLEISCDLTRSELLVNGTHGGSR